MKAKKHGPEAYNPKRKPRPRQKWCYDGPTSAEDWIRRADGKARILHAAAVLSDGRLAHARMYREIRDLLYQGIVCVMQLQKPRKKT